MNKQRRAISIVSITLALIIMTTLMIGTIAFAAPTSDMLVMDNADMLTNEDEAKLKMPCIKSMNRQTLNMLSIWHRHWMVKPSKKHLWKPVEN